MSITNNCINKIKQHDSILNLKCYTEFFMSFLYLVLEFVVSCIHV